MCLCAATSASLYGRGNVTRISRNPTVHAPLNTRLSRPSQGRRGYSKGQVSDLLSVIRVFSLLAILPLRYTVCVLALQVVAQSAGAVEGTVGKEAYGIRRARTSHFLRGSFSAAFETGKRRICNLKSRRQGEGEVMAKVWHAQAHRMDLLLGAAVSGHSVCGRGLLHHGILKLGGQPHLAPFLSCISSLHKYTHNMFLRTYNCLHQLCHFAPTGALPHA